MSKLPPRRVLIGIVYDAISDRNALEDESVAQETAETIEKYKGLSERLNNSGRKLEENDREILRLACLHARIWRESYLDSWRGTGDRAVILEAKQDIDRVTRTENALGGRYVTALDYALAHGRSVSILELGSQGLTKI